MATLTNPQIPPSLQQGFSQLITLTANPGGGAATRANIHKGARRAEQRSGMKALPQFASAAAAWLTDAWRPGRSSLERSPFYRDRRQEIIDGVFPAPYWVRLTPTQDRTEFGLPSVMPYNGEWNPNYWDELRKPSRCIFNLIEYSYPTPPDQGTPDNPAPGWSGAVVATVWRDSWLAQRRLRYTLPCATRETDDRPIALRIDWTIQAQATLRGNRNWFSPIAIPCFYHPLDEGNIPNRMVTHWAPPEQYTRAIPEQDPGGWEHAVAYTLIRDARRYAVWVSGGASSQLALRLATPPALGIYYSRNDAVNVSHRETVGVFVAMMI